VGAVADILYTETPLQQPPWPLIWKLADDKEKLSAPWKGHIPLMHEEGALWLLKQKGAVMEVEQVAKEEAQPCAVLEAAKAQKVVAHFFRWMHAGKMELQLQPN